MSTMSCENCDRLSKELLETSQVLERIREFVNGVVKINPPRRPKGYEEFTVYGKLIADAADAKDMELADVSDRIGRAHDYVMRVCRGRIRLVRSAAFTIGAALQLDLLPFVVTRPRKRAVKTQVREPELPLIAVPEPTTGEAA